VQGCRVPQHNDAVTRSAAKDCGARAQASVWPQRIILSPEVPMSLHLTIGPIVSLVAGILILIVPRLLSYIVAIYLIIIGLLELSGSGGLHI
jgi:hypothetical protein